MNVNDHSVTSCGGQSYYTLPFRPRFNIRRAKLIPKITATTPMITPMLSEMVVVIVSVNVVTVFAGKILAIVIHLTNLIF